MNQYFTTTWLDPIFATYEQFVNGVGAYLPTLVGAILVLIIGYITAYLLKRLVLRIGGGTTSIVRRFSGQNAASLNRLPWPVSSIIANIVFWLVIAFFLTVTARILGLPSLAAWLATAAGILPRFLLAVVIIFAAYSLALILRDAVRDMMAEGQAHGANLVAQTGFVLVNLIGVIIGTEQLGIDLALLESLVLILAAAFVFGLFLAFALGASRAIENIIAGYYVRQIYSVGQRVRISDIEGEILDVKPTAVLVDSSQGRAVIPAKLFHQEVSVLLDGEDGPR